LGYSATWAGATLGDVQRLFSMFPQGGPGIALLLLRLSLAGTMVLVFRNRFGVLWHWASPGLVIVAILLCLGWLTPIISTISCLVAIAGFFYVGDDLAVVAPFVFNAVALILLGPGAYSLDARIFGRRVFNVPPGKASHAR